MRNTVVTTSTEMIKIKISDFSSSFLLMNQLIMGNLASAIAGTVGRWIGDFAAILSAPRANKTS